MKHNPLSKYNVLSVLTKGCKCECDGKSMVDSDSKILTMFTSIGTAGGVSERCADGILSLTV